MLQTQTVKTYTLELLKKLQSINEFSNFRLVGETALALQIGHRVSVDLYHKKYPEATDFLLYKSLIYFQDAEKEPMPKMFKPLSWDKVKKRILEIADKELM